MNTDKYVDLRRLFDLSSSVDSPHTLVECYHTACYGLSRIHQCLLSALISCDAAWVESASTFTSRHFFWSSDASSNGQTLTENVMQLFEKKTLCLIYFPESCGNNKRWGLAVNKDRQMDCERFFWTFPNLSRPEISTGSSPHNAVMWHTDIGDPPPPKCLPICHLSAICRTSPRAVNKAGLQECRGGALMVSKVLNFMKHVACWTFCLQVYSKGTSSFDLQQENIFIFHLLPFKNPNKNLLSDVLQPPRSSLNLHFLSYSHSSMI